ncbi:hypothetical protein IBX73_11200 [candidate division WOR-3 bacterium]|nr:hypothetical protein [candidate division WOR-3 bacterium]
MKKGFALVALMVTGAVILSCGKEYTRLNMLFGEQPVGGRDVTELRCVAVGRLEGGDTPIQAKLEGWATAQIGVDEVLYGYDTWTFRTTEWEELRIIVQVPPGYVLVGYFWFTCSWTDEDGTRNTLYSDTAHCYH